MSPRRPRQSASASPAVLLQPDPPEVQEVLEEVAQRFEASIMATFEDIDGVDDDNALSKALNQLAKFEFDLNDIEFTFNQIEIKMTTAGVKKNFTKFQVLSSIIPKKIQDQVKSLLRKNEAAFPNKDAYRQLKQKILTIFGPSCEANFDRALQRTLTGMPSELARALVDDICKKELNGCCCTGAVASLWKRALPLAVKQAVSHLEFNKDTFESVVAVADKVWASSRPSGVTIAAMQSPAAESVEESMNQGFIADPGDPVQVAAQSIVAAVQKFSTRGNNRGRGQRGGRGRGNRGGGRGGGQNQNQGKPHRWSNLTKSADNPPNSVCKKHYVFGKSAHWCEEPVTCPWKDYFIPKNQQ